MFVQALSKHRALRSDHSGYYQLISVNLICVERKVCLGLNYFSEFHRSFKHLASLTVCVSFRCNIT